MAAQSTGRRLSYNGTLRRRARSAGRLISQSASPAVWRSGAAVRAYWWDAWLNFGDTLTPFLLPRLGITAVHCEPTGAELSGVGSLIQFLPPGWQGTVWGSGLIRDIRHPMPRANAIAVRGPLTAERIGACEDGPFGDPGLLVSKFVKRSPARWDFVIVPHAYQRNRPEIAGLARHLAKAGSTHVVDVRQGARAAAREISAARRVFSTSLHGLVVADSFGIPVAWSVLEPGIDGGKFKFRDYEAVITPRETRFRPFGLLLNSTSFEHDYVAADPSRVASVCRGLTESLDAWRDESFHRTYPSELLNTLRAKYA